MRRGLLSLLILCLLVGPACAEGAAKAKKPPVGTTVEMPVLMAPMSQDGRLLGYAFITSKLVCASSDACIAVREKLAFIQDANVRDVNAQPIALANDPTAVDRDLLNQRLTANAKRIVGENKVKNMVFLTVHFTPLHPSESTTGATPPDQAAPGGAVAGPSTGTPPPNGAPVPVAGTATPAAATSKPPSSPAH